METVFNENVYEAQYNENMIDGPIDQVGEKETPVKGNGNYNKEYDTYYSKYANCNNIPISSNYDPSTFEYGYSFLPPEKWYPEPVHAPVCITDRAMPNVLPIGTSGFPYDHKNWI